MLMFISNLLYKPVSSLYLAHNKLWLHIGNLYLQLKWSP